MKTSIAKRVAALAVIVTGLLLLVLAPAGDAVMSYRIVGVMTAAVGIAWLTAQRPSIEEQRENAANFERRKLNWYQSPIVLFPIILIVIAALTYALAQ